MNWTRIRTKVNLNGRVTTRVVNLAGVNLLDRHGAGRGSVSFEAWNEKAGIL